MARTSTSKGEVCSNLRGLWRNDLGSEMVILQDDDYHITGEYLTTVGSREGVTGCPATLSGVVKPLEEGSLVSWNVLWSGGKSMTTWVGQCTTMLSGGKVIHATWLLKTMESNPDKKWFSNRINHDTFVKVVASHSPETPFKVEQVGENEGLVGSWNSVSEDAFRIDVAAKTGNVFGVYLTPDASTSAESPKDLIGLTNYEKDYVAVAFSAAGLHEVKGWTGFIYDPEGLGEEPQPPVLETSWISHRFSQNIQNPRRFVKFGVDDYRMESAVTSPRKGAKKEVVEVQLD